MRRNFRDSYVKSVGVNVADLFFQVKAHVREYKPQVAQVLCVWGPIKCSSYVNSPAFAYFFIQAIFKRITDEKSLIALNFNVVLHNYCFAAPKCQNKNRQNF